MHLIIADDSAVSRAIFSAVCKEAGHDVVEAANGQAAIDAFAEHPCSMILLDWSMPLVDGPGVCRHIRKSETDRETFILMVTGRSSSSDVAAAMDAGADDFIAKPVLPEHLRARLQIAERWLEQSRVRRRAQKALSQAQWLRGISETSHAVSHEINNPLQAVMMEAALLESDETLSDAHRVQATVIRTEAVRIAQAVKRLSEITSGQRIQGANGARLSRDYSDLTEAVRLSVERACDPMLGERV